MNIAAIILSAGYASRMGRLKPLLPLGDGTVIEKTIHCFQHAGIDKIIAVLGHRAGDIEPLMDQIGVERVVNPQYRQGMLTSIQAGIRRLNSDVEAFFIMPADIPLIRPPTLRLLVAAYGHQPSNIVCPLFNGKSGHPPLIPAGHAQSILKWRGENGLRGYLEKEGRKPVCVNTADQGVLMDMDTPQDYDRILGRMTRLDIPTPAEALALLHIYREGDQELIAHSRAVAWAAVKIGKLLNQAGENVNLDIIEAAGLLHDIAKGETNHAQRGAELLMKEGFQGVADAVRTHMNIAVDPAGDVNENKVVYLADKMLRGSDRVTLEKRLKDKTEELAGNPAAVRTAALRMKNAIKIRMTVEAITGVSLEKALA